MGKELILATHPIKHHANRKPSGALADPQDLPLILCSTRVIH
ncbi:hypothetical protein RSSM_01925 [Rhodopirellula sallentina SM41]|uniref:Uncharacterized protein n=1 Tax=Rhodopirellula sallentina SM41 TaxID=1263870 RepID=M5UFP1_9BACT|nr:hypothetical protein RSSM_01925 [Rhodopirellula sallentina SM41]